MPTIVSSKGQSNIEAIKRYFCSEYACQMVAQAAGVDARFEAICCDDLEHLTDAVLREAREGGYGHIVCADPLTRGLSQRRGGTKALVRAAPCPVVLAGQTVAAA